MVARIWGVLFVGLDILYLFTFSLNLFAIRFIYLTMYYEYLLFECISLSLELWSIINSIVIPALGYSLLSKPPFR